MPWRRRRDRRVTFKPVPETPASILYTSGTTGRPKGCVLSHGYEVASGAWYAALGGAAGLRPGEDRIYNPLPLYHANAGVVSLMGAILTGNCQIQPDRFHAAALVARGGRDAAPPSSTISASSRPLLLNLPPGAHERRHRSASASAPASSRSCMRRSRSASAFPLIELWGMTEMVRVLGDTVEPRQVGTRAFGRAVPGVDVRVVDDEEHDVAGGRPGEMLVRHSAATPRRGCFSGYLKDEAATEAAWRGGWFHTGDVVWRGPDGMLHFVDRKKNIIRRSGENIAAAEVEAILLTHPDVQQAAVMAVKDELRDEEVLACVVLKRALRGQGGGDGAVPALLRASRLLQGAGLDPHRGRACRRQARRRSRSTTSIPAGTDPRGLPAIIDLRGLKRRGNP